MKIIITTTLVLFAFIGFAQQIKKNVDASTFKKLIAEKKYILIDLRTSDEIKSKGKIKDAIQLDFLAKNSESIIEKLDKIKSYLIYCASGGRSGDCADLMEKQGFTEVINLEKGFTDWKNKGFEIDKK